MKLNLFVFLGLMALPVVSQASDPVYCNGQRIQYAGNLYYPNAQRVQYAGDFRYPNGNRTIYAGDRLYPNGKRLKYAGDELYMNGQRVLYAGDLYYPNGQRVKVAGDCYFNTGVRMDRCPKTVRFLSIDGDFESLGVLDLTAKKIVSQSYELRANGVRTRFEVGSDGSISDIDALCE